ncbi:hypothetical protein LTR85_005039 [Meristemomyces frigidus]|nr:hypothetical protein LTR85_005039 [Meristemomyces frigidus]
MVMPNLLILLHSAALLEQLYAFTLHFSKPANGHRARTHRNALVLLSAGCTISATIGLLLARPTLASISGGLAALLLLSGILLFAWAALTSRPGRFSAIFGEVKPEEVVSHGPYAYLRHPTYAAYSLAWLGAIVAMFAAEVEVHRFLVFIACACYAGLLLLYYRAAVQEEAQFTTNAADGTRERYKAYQRRVKARWVPGIA